MIPNHENHFRFPLLEAIKKDKPNFKPAIQDAPTDKYSTTTSKSKRIYDQIIISKGSYNEFTDTPKFGEDVGIIPFDNDKHYEWFIDNWHNATGMLSDHRPVWIRLRIDKGDDD